MSWRNQRISGYSVADIAARDALTGLNPGDIVVVADDGTGNEATYIWTGNGWLEIVSNPGAPLHLVGTADEVQFSVTGFAGQATDIVQLISDAGTLSYDNAGDLTVPNDLIYDTSVKGVDANSPQLLDQTPSATIPNILTNRDDTDTGIGGRAIFGGDILYLIAGGVTGLGITESGGAVTLVSYGDTIVTGDVEADGQIYANGTGGDVIQLLVQGNAAQSTNYFEIITSASGEVFRVGPTAMEFNIGGNDFFSVYADGPHVNTEAGYGTTGLWMHYVRSEGEGLKFCSGASASTDATIYRNAASSIVFGNGAGGYSSVTANNVVADNGLSVNYTATNGFQANYFQNGASLGSLGQFGWTATDASAVLDTGLERIGAAHVGVTDGGSGVGDFTANTFYSTFGNNDVVISSDEGASGATIAGWASQDSDFSLEPQGWYCFEDMGVQNEGVYGVHSGTGDAHVWFVEGYGNNTYGSLFGQESATDPLCVASVEQGTYGAAIVASSSGGFSTAGFQIEAITASPHTLNSNSNYSGTDINKVFTTTGASGNITQNLPASAGDGRVYTFIQTSANTQIITANGTDVIRAGTGASSAGGTLTSSAQGSSVTLVDAESGTWYATSLTGTWTPA